MSLQTLYDTVVTTPSDINEHLMELHRVIVELDAQTVIELGVRYGTSTIALLHALEKTGGHLWSVDVAKLWNGIPADRWTFVQGEDITPHVMAQLPERADVIFIDTDHRYNLTLAEIIAYKSRVREGGCMIFHDTNVEVFEHHTPGSEPPFPVRRAVDELLGEYEKTVFMHNNGLTEVWL